MSATCNVARLVAMLQGNSRPLPTPEVIDALDPPMSAYDALSDDELIAAGRIARDARQTLREVTRELHARGHTYTQIGELLGATASAASRWALPADPPGRRRTTTRSFDE